MSMAQEKMKVIWQLIESWPVVLTAYVKLPLLN